MKNVIKKNKGILINHKYPCLTAHAGGFEVRSSMFEVGGYFAGAKCRWKKCKN
jgi:hypothetical protein